MKMNGYKLLWILVFTMIVSLLPGVPCHATSISNAQWRELTNDKAFSYKDEKEMHKATKQNANENAFATFWRWIVVFFSSPAGKSIIWLTFFFVIGYAIFKAFFSEHTQLFGKHKKAPPSPDNDNQLQSEDVLTTDWETYLKQAMAANDIRLAVRYSYMHLLQLLQQRQYIQYRADKTNNDYYHELNNDEIRQPFRRLTRQYEFAWYGNYPVQQQAYDHYMETFNALKNRISRS